MLAVVAALPLLAAALVVDVEDLRDPIEDPVLSFTDVTEAAGLMYMQSEVPYGECYMPVISEFSCGTPEKMSGGATVGDFDNDGWDDLFVTRLDANDILYKNNGDGTFSDATEAAGLSGFDDFHSNGAGFADLDNDGDLDLVVMAFGSKAHQAFINQGDGTFVEDAEARGLSLSNMVPSLDDTPIDVLMGTSVAFGDYDRDGWVDVYLTEWRMLQVIIDNNGTDAYYGDGCTRTSLEGCTPQLNRLMHNLGAQGQPGVFEDVTDISGVNSYTSAVFGAAFVDIDKDGLLDITTAADWGTFTSSMFWGLGEGLFTSGVSAISGNQVGSEDSGMGLTFGDIDNDGDLDRYATAICRTHEPLETTCHLEQGGNRLHRYDGDRFFSDQTEAYGIIDGGWGWGAAIADFDNDGDLDVFTTNGVQVPSMPSDRDYITDRTRYFSHVGTASLEFDEVSLHVGVNDTREGKGLVVFDYDKDGDLDVFLVNTFSTPILYRNDASESLPANQWLRVKITPPEPVADASFIFEGLNAKITVTYDGFDYYHEMGVLTHFYGMSERIAHYGFGPGGSGVADVVEICWLVSGECTTITDVPVNQVLTVAAPSSELVAPTNSLSESQSESQTSGMTDSPAVTQSQTQAAPDTQSQTEAAPDTQSQTAQPDTQSDAAAETQSQAAQPDTQSDAAAETESNTPAANPDDDDDDDDDSNDDDDDDDDDDGPSFPMGEGTCEPYDPALDNGLCADIIDYPVFIADNTNQTAIGATLIELEDSFRLAALFYPDCGVAGLYFACVGALPRCTSDPAPTPSRPCRSTCDSTNQICMDAFILGCQQQGIPAEECEFTDCTALDPLGVPIYPVGEYTDGFTGATLQCETDSPSGGDDDDDDDSVSAASLALPTIVLLLLPLAL